MAEEKIKDVQVTPKGARLAFKIAQIIEEMDGVPKTGRNEFQKYAFQTNSLVVETIGKLMGKYHISLWCSMTGHKQEGNKTLAQFVFTFENGEEPFDTRDVLWVGEANDTGDKGTSKAATAAQKYMLIKTFMVSSEESDREDADKSSVETRKTPPLDESLAGSGKIIQAGERFTIKADLKIAAAWVAKYTDYASLDVVFEELGQAPQEFESTEELVAAIKALAQAKGRVIPPK